MPIYEYQCQSCHHHFDLMQKISDAPVNQCPKCFKETAVRLISAAGFQLKGTGWYATDFKTKQSAGSSEPSSNDSVNPTAEPSKKDHSSPDKPSASSKKSKESND